MRIDGRLYVDGGVADNTPISQAVALGADTVYVLPTGVSMRLEKKPAIERLRDPRGEAA